MSSNTRNACTANNTLENQALLQLAEAVGVAKEYVAHRWQTTGTRPLPLPHHLTALTEAATRVEAHVSGATGLFLRRTEAIAWQCCEHWACASPAEEAVRDLLGAIRAEANERFPLFYAGYSV